MNIKIGSIKGLNKLPNSVYIRVDRSSILGNPFLLERPGWRGHVIKAYRHWLYRALEEGSTDLTPYLYGLEWKSLKAAPKYKNPTQKEIQEGLNKILNYYLEGKDITLLCWCYPLPCHAEIIREVIYSLAKVVL
jgi:hypothetical protein